MALSPLSGWNPRSASLSRRVQGREQSMSEEQRFVRLQPKRTAFAPPRELPGSGARTNLTHARARDQVELTPGISSQARRHVVGLESSARSLELQASHAPRAAAAAVLPLSAPPPATPSTRASFPDQRSFGGHPSGITPNEEPSRSQNCQLPISLPAQLHPSSHPRLTRLQADRAARSFTGVAWGTRRKGGRGRRGGRAEEGRQRSWAVR